VMLPIIHGVCSVKVSISTFFLAASFVQNQKHVEERDSIYSLTPTSFTRSKSLQFRQSIPAPLRRLYERALGPSAFFPQNLLKINNLVNPT
jgi:hypothetical protein